MENASTQSAEGTKNVVRRAVITCAGAFLFCFAMIPLYSIYCDITGANGRGAKMGGVVTQTVDMSRKIRVEFTGSVNSALPWDFVPEVETMEVHPGEPALAWYVATNRGKQANVGNAAPSVAPNEASIFFNKTECFCFTEQKMEAGEVRRMPVRFVVDTALPDEVKVMTLAYSFYLNDTATHKLVAQAPAIL